MIRSSMVRIILHNLLAKELLISLVRLFQFNSCLSHQFGNAMF